MNCKTWIFSSVFLSCFRNQISKHPEIRIYLLEIQNYEVLRLKQEHWQALVLNKLTSFWFISQKTRFLLIFASAVNVSWFKDVCNGKQDRNTEQENQKINRYKKLFAYFIVCEQRYSVIKLLFLWFISSWKCVGRFIFKTLTRLIPNFTQTWKYLNDVISNPFK